MKSKQEIDDLNKTNAATLFYVLNKFGIKYSGSWYDTDRVNYKLFGSRGPTETIHKYVMDAIADMELAKYVPSEIRPVMPIPDDIEFELE
jgi:hypothetical protein